MAAGVAALILSLDPAQASFDVLETLRLTSRDLGNPGADDFFGVGLVDAHLALKVTEIGILIFEDGFETGDLSSWSTAPE